MGDSTSSDASRRGKSSRRKGSDTERMVAAWLRENGWPDAKRRLAGNGQAGDIDGVPGVLIETKYVARSAWPSWQRQALAEATPDTRLVVVVRRTHGNSDVGLWEARWARFKPWPSPEAWTPWSIGYMDLVLADIQAVQS